MTTKRKQYPKELKLEVVHEFEAGKTCGQLAREYDIHPSLPSRWAREYRENPEEAFSGPGVPTRSPFRAKNASPRHLSWLPGQEPPRQTAAVAAPAAPVETAPLLYGPPTLYLASIVTETRSRQ